MKKILSTTILSCLIASSAYASVGDLMYIRADATYTKFNNVSIVDNITTVGQYNDPMAIKGGKYRHPYNLGAMVGLGYMLKDNMRTEIVYNKIYPDKFKFASPTAGTSAKVKANINTFLCRLIYDVMDLGPVSLYIGGGLGVANVRHKVVGMQNNVTITTQPAVPAQVGPPAVAAQPAVRIVQNQQFTFKSKSRNNAAYSLIFGFTANATDSLHVDVGYAFTDYGQTSRVVGMNGGKIALKAHSLSVGFRFDVM